MQGTVNDLLGCIFNLLISSKDYTEGKAYSKVRTLPKNSQQMGQNHALVIIIYSYS